MTSDVRRFYDARTALEKCVVVGTHIAVLQRPIGVGLRDALTLEGGRLLDAEEPFSGEIRGPLQWRERGVRPKALQVGVTPRRE
jgi:hypothetical protein